MSYCRWSSDDFQCDVYVYEDCAGGWTTHVAGRKHVLTKKLPPHVDMSDIKKWMERDKKVSRILEKSKLVQIGLPYDGETFNDPTPGECADRLESLREIGYRVPQYAIDALIEEAGE